METHYVRAHYVIGYSADAATWCPACAHLVYDRYDPTYGPHNVRTAALDHESNPVHPIFADSEDYGSAICDRCAEVLDCWTVEL